VPQPPRVKYVGGNDELLLEDQMQRVMLTGNISSKELVTGETERRGHSEFKLEKYIPFLWSGNVLCVLVCTSLCL